ncbi:MAG: uracil-DNA glycosylase [Candidatus Babeliales bacterium]
MDIKSFKQELLNELYEPYQNCTMCPLGTLGRENVVFGEGNPDAALIFVGEGPGAEEDAQNRPFVGRSGKLLTKTLSHIGLKREEVFITNIVKCRPPGNRTPTTLESNTCKEILLFKQIKIIRPLVICTLGSAAIQGLIDKPIKITKTRGNVLIWNNISVVPAYHPAYILRNPSEQPIFISDIKLAAELSAQKTPH